MWRHGSCESFKPEKIKGMKSMGLNSKKTSSKVTNICCQAICGRLLAVACVLLMLHCSGSRASAGLVVWLDAGAGVTVDENGAVSAWNDQSGNGNNATQATAARQPLLAANQLNGNSVIRFDGVNDILQIVAPSSMVGLEFFTMYVVGRYNSTAGDQVMFAGTNANTYSSGNQYFWFSSMSATNEISLNLGLSDNPPAHNGPTNTNYSTYGLEFAWAGLGVPNTTTWVDDDVAITGSNYSTLTIAENGRLDIGALIHAGTQYYAGNVDIAEIRIYNTALTEAERNLVQAELDAKYFPVPEPSAVALMAFGSAAVFWVAFKRRRLTRRKLSSK